MHTNLGGKWCHWKALPPRKDWIFHVYLCIYLKHGGSISKLLKMVKVTVGKYDQNAVTFFYQCCCRWHLQLPFSVVREGFCPCLKKLLARRLQNERGFILLVFLGFFFLMQRHTIMMKQMLQTLVATLAVSYQRSRSSCLVAFRG